MPQHLWGAFGNARVCEVCLESQVKGGAGWTPPVSTICPGDDDDDRPSAPGRRRPKPLAPSDAPEPTSAEPTAARRLGRKVARADNLDAALAWGLVVLLRQSGHRPSREMIDRVLISGGASTAEVAT